MGRTCSLLILVSLISLSMALTCKPGFILHRGNCVDEDECQDEDHVQSCGDNTSCLNTNGGFLCVCKDGFRTSRKTYNFTTKNPDSCSDINECTDNATICGPNTVCNNTIGGYKCYCQDGFETPDGKKESTNFSCKDIDECLKKDICGKNASCKNSEGAYACVCDEGFENFGDPTQCKDICVINNTICGNGACHHGADGHYCVCPSGFSNYSNAKLRCTELNWGKIKGNIKRENFALAYDLMVKLSDQCKDIAENETSKAVAGKSMTKRLLSVIDQLLSGEPFSDNRKVSTFLDTVEFMLRFTGPFNTPPGLNESSNYTELKLHLHKGSVMPQGNVMLPLNDAALHIQMETVAGEISQYPDFAAVSLLSYKNLEKSADEFFEGLKQDGKSFKINSKIVTVAVTNENTSSLKEPVLITFTHLKQLKLKQTPHCAFWDSSLNGGSWSSHGCTVKESNRTRTVCSCNHLSSFAVLMALYDVEDKFALQLITWVGLSLSLICLFICILTFGLIRSIQSQRTKIHLHLSISLFLAFFIFLIGISRTENKVGCAVVAGLLHFFFLASFCWMCLEGIQLFRMVVLVFNSSFRTLYLMAAGYGLPAVIVSVSALANAKGYGTERYCWLNLDSIWSFFGPACIIIFVNIIFFLITVWKLAQKFSSLNPDLDNLQKIKTFTITAVAQLCILGITWIFGCFQFEEGTIAMTYLFTIFASLQGFLLFIMHCLCSKQIRDEYRNILSRCCAPQKKTYSEFGYTHSSKAQASKSTQDTGESNL